MAASVSIVNPSQKTQEGIIEYLKHCSTSYQKYYSVRSAMEEIDREYYRENNFTPEQLRAHLANRVGDASKYQDITIPIVMPQVEAFVTYQASVFLTGTPLFGVVASPQYEDAARQMEALLADQAARCGWKAQLVKFFRDLGKYNLGACEVSWEAVNVPSFETDLAFSRKEARPRNIIWEGNQFKRMDLYNTFWDTQVLPQDVAKLGEYAGYNELITRTQLKQFIAGLGTDAIVGNITQAFETPTPINEYYIPQINPSALVSYSGLQIASSDWFSWAGIAAGRTDIAYKSTYLKTVLYIRMIPSEFGLKVPQPNTPQVWKLVIINQSVLIYAERQTNAHEMIPILFAAPNDDGIKYQSKSLASNVLPMQQVGTTMLNSMIAARRRAISDRGIYNPLYIESKDINSSNPAAKIPCKPTAYAGVALAEMYHSIPFNDDQAGLIMQEVNVIASFADIISGQNKAQQGQFVKGNKTLHEYADIMGNANGRSQLQAIIIEDQFFSQAKVILSSNILQYQGEAEIYHEEKKQEFKIDPLVLRNAIMKFKISDGLTPSDKLINSDAWQVAMQIVGSSPTIGPAYNIGPMFSYLMKTQGADVSEFEKPKEQQMYEQAIVAWQQTVLQISKTNPEATANNFPPQPLPEQFGLGKDGLPVAQAQAQLQGEEKEKSIIEQVMEMGGQRTESQEAQPTMM